MSRVLGRVQSLATHSTSRMTQRTFHTTRMTQEQFLDVNGEARRAVNPDACR